MGIKAINLGKYSKYLGLLLLIGLSTSLVRSYQKAAKTKALVEREKKKIEELKSQNEKLEEDLARVKSEEFIEKQLRDRLGLAKAGEIVLVLPDLETLRKLAPKVGEEEESLPDPTWKKWANLFF
ncbi:septum formation initiator family protein [Candidatus Woesebacteria bacterium]|nr:septum formation initiator family protein [Candidatus Woesebacteria bacterium]